MSEAVKYKVVEASLLPSDFPDTWHEPLVTVVKFDTIDALRAENARLRGLLAEIQYDCEHIGGIQHLDKAERRTWVSVANRIKDALQPERGTK